ncbi:MAG: hypothetical protein HY040_00175 [Planctomycetes bacterium]|nr:hypothetical protein [Planctomycetota bacterium]
MKSQVAAMKAAAINACRLRGFPFSEFMEEWGLEGLEDILLDAESNNLTPKDIAVRVLCECCVTEGKFNNFQVGLLSVVSYLTESLGPLGQGGQQSFKDLLSILNQGGSAQAVTEWMNTHFP